MEEKVTFGALTVYRTRGDFLRRLEQYQKAKDSYDVAYRQSPNDVQLLVGRSQACSLAVQPQQAFADADLALKLEPTNQIAVTMQARALYTMTEFERSLVMNYRGSAIRTQPPYFFEGINQGLETIQDCIGKGSGEILLEYLPLIKELEEMNYFDGLEVKEPLRVSRIPRQEEKPHVTIMEYRRHELLARVMAMKYLGPMAYDKFFLKQLVNDERLDSANAAGTRALKECANAGHNILAERQNMMRAQRPYYCIKLAEKAESKYMNKFKENMLKQERDANRFTVRVLMKQLRHSWGKGRTDQLMTQVTRIQTFLDSKTPKSLPSKDKFMHQLYTVVGQAYLSMYKLSHHMSDRGNRRRIAFLMGLEVGRPSSFDSVLASYPRKYMDFKHALEKYMHMLNMCENATHRCYIFYELSRLMCSQKNFSNTKYYAKRCQREAEEKEDSVWWCLGALALLAPDLQQHNTNEVRVQVEETLLWAKQTAFFGALEGFLEKCKELASETIDSDEHKAVLQREKQVLSVMVEPQRVEQEVLFKRMWTVPPRRMFSVLPSRPKPKDPQAERRRRRQPGLTVVPGQPATLPATRKSTVRGYQEFDI